MTTDQNKDLTAGDLMDFLRKFQSKMEDTMEDTQRSIEITNRKIDGRLNTIDDEIKKIHDKFNDNDEKNEEINERMDLRLKKLEEEMIKATRLRRRSKDLEDLEKKLENQSEESEDRSMKILEKKKNDALKKKKVETVTSAILQEPAGTFRSTWARGIQRELELAAAASVSGEDVYSSGRRSDVPDVPAVAEEIFTDAADAEDHDVLPENWEDRLTESPAWRKLRQKKTTPPPIRKPPILDWFGFDTTDESEPENEEWSAVERKKKGIERRQRAAKRKEKIKRESALRASHMVSIGPISLGSVEYFRQNGETFENAKKAAVKEFMKYNLDYSDEELDNLRIAETRISTKGDDIVNVALEDEEEVKGLYSRKAESRNDNIVLRSYIPPNYHERFMYLNGICTEKRRSDPNLKTQLRFGKKDVEIFTKVKGDTAGYRKVEIHDFTDPQEVPEFNHKIKWKNFVDKPPRSSVNRWKDRGQRPSTIGQQPPTRKIVHNNPPRRTSEDADIEKLGHPARGKEDGRMTRANSNTTTSTKKQQKRYNTVSSEEDDEEMNSGDEDSQEFATPAGEKTL